MTAPDEFSGLADADLSDAVFSIDNLAEAPQVTVDGFANGAGESYQIRTGSARFVGHVVAVHDTAFCGSSAEPLEPVLSGLALPDLKASRDSASRKVATSRGAMPSASSARAASVAYPRPQRSGIRRTRVRGAQRLRQHP